MATRDPTRRHRRRGRARAAPTGVLAAVLVVVDRSPARHSRAIALRSDAPRVARARPAERRFVARRGRRAALVALVPLMALVDRSFSTPTGWSTRRLDPSRAAGGASRLCGSASTRSMRSRIADHGGLGHRSPSSSAPLASLAITAARRHGRLIDGGTDAAARHVCRHDRPRHADHVRHRSPVDWRASWWLVPVGHALVAVPFVVRSASACCVRSTRRCPTPRRRSAQPGAGVAVDRGAVPVGVRWASAPARRSDLARRVRRDELPVPLRRRDLADRHRAAPRPHRHDAQAQGYVLATLLAVGPSCSSSSPNGSNRRRPADADAAR